MKRLPTCAAILLGLTSIVLIINRHSGRSEGEQGSGLSPRPDPSHSEGSTTPTRNSQKRTLPLVKLVADSQAPNPIDEGPAEAPPFRAQGQTLALNIVDQEGHVLLASGDRLGIEGIIPAPGYGHIFVESYTKNQGTFTRQNFVLNPATGEKINLPEYPPVVGAISLRCWSWTDDHTLVALSGIPHPDWYACTPPLDETFLYTFDIDTRQLSQIALPAHLQESELRVSSNGDGHVHLKIELGGEHSEETEVGWFSLQQPE